MSKSWRRRHQRDHYRRKARAEGYRSRAAYKLKEIVRRHDAIKRGDVVVDLGAAPGGWTQIAAEAVGQEGRVVAVDLKPIDELPGPVETVQGDVTDDDTLQAVRALVGDADVVISDMAPRISGNYSMDHAKSVHLARAALEAAGTLLRPGGRIVIKVFQGDLFKAFYDDVGRQFSHHRGHKPKASRKQSSETYVLGFGYKGPNRE